MPSEKLCLKIVEDYLSIVNFRILKQWGAETGESGLFLK